MKRFFAALSAALLAATCAFAGNLAVDGNLTVAGTTTGTGTSFFGAVCTVSASSNAGTCNGQRGTYTTASLSTAHSAAATAQTVTNSAVAGTSSIVLCSVTAYSGTFGTNGNPTAACIATGASTFTINIVNAADTNALSGTVGVSFLVIN